MNRKWKKIVQKCLFNKWSLVIWKPFWYVAHRLQASKINFEQHPQQEALQAEAELIFKDKVVLHGPFKGLQFNTINSEASANYAKLLGSYEEEIHPFIQTVLQRNYETIINIGSDNGYYAVGLATKMPAVKLVAFETNKKAWIALKSVAEQNGVAAQIEQRSLFTAAQVQEFAHQKRNLFIIDCEGAEKDIFVKNNIMGLQNADFIIELHVHLYPELETYFRDLFSSTHHINIVNSIPDFLKASQSKYPEIAHLNFDLKHFITAEREVFMQWIFLSSKAMNSHEG